MRVLLTTAHRAGIATAPLAGYADRFPEPPTTRSRRPAEGADPPDGSSRDGPAAEIGARRRPPRLARARRGRGHRPRAIRAAARPRVRGRAGARRPRRPGG